LSSSLLNSVLVDSAVLHDGCITPWFSGGAKRRPLQPIVRHDKGYLSCAVK